MQANPIKLGLLWDYMSEEIGARGIGSEPWLLKSKMTDSIGLISYS